MRGALSGALVLVVSICAAAAPKEARNWFGDPYFQLTNDIAACPEPRGPFITETEALSESHHRAERGTRCHLEGRCKYPSSFDYDKDIAAKIKAAQRHAELAPRPSTLWVLVQGRRVWVYGCVATGYRRGLLEKRLRGIADVEVAVEGVRAGPHGEIPYRVR